MVKLPKFRKKPVVVEAIQWFKNGDHPNDDVFRPFEDTGAIPTEPREGAVVRYFRHPAVDGNSLCEYCGRVMNDHGWIDTGGRGHFVCPSDWIITREDGVIHPCKDYVFKETYEPME